jgi:hypothetical protein
MAISGVARSVILGDGIETKKMQMKLGQRE